MERTMILVAGMPATGKTTLANYLSNKLKMPLVCKDRLKEIIWDGVRRGTTEIFGGNFLERGIKLRRGMQ